MDRERTRSERLRRGPEVGEGARKKGEKTIGKGVRRNLRLLGLDWRTDSNDSVPCPWFLEDSTGGDSRIEIQQVLAS